MDNIQRDTKMNLLVIAQCLFILSIRFQRPEGFEWSFNSFRNQPFHNQQIRKSGQSMKQTPLHGQYLLPYENINLYHYSFSKFCTYPQNYIQNFAFYSQNQLFPYYYQPQYGQFCPQGQAIHTMPTISPQLISEQTDQNVVQRADTHVLQSIKSTIMTEIVEQVDQERDLEEQRKKMRRESRIRHMTEVNKNRVLRKIKKSLTSYYWNSEENKRYIDFLRTHPGLFDLPVSEKKNIRVNVMMSKKVKSRTPQQCHSHHQKMMKKYGNVQNIVQMMQNQGSQNLEKQKVERDRVKDQIKFQNQFIDS